MDDLHLDASCYTQMTSDSYLSLTGISSDIRTRQPYCVKQSQQQSVSIQRMLDLVSLPTSTARLESKSELSLHDVKQARACLVVIGWHRCSSAAQLDLIRVEVLRQCFHSIRLGTGIRVLNPSQGM